MKRLLGVLAAALISTSYSSAATASPTFEYGFVVDAASCVRADDVIIEDCMVLDYHVEWLERTRVVLTLDAVLSDRARYFLQADPWEIQSYENFGVVSVKVSDTIAFTDPPRTCGGCIVDVEFTDIPESLSGRFVYFDSIDTVGTYMGGDRTWSGRLLADILDANQIAYTGHWRLMRVVPEPGTLAVLGLGLAGLAFTRRLKQ